MSCSGGKSTKKGGYNKADNLKKPTGYTVDKKGNVKPDGSLRDTERIPLDVDIDDYFEKEASDFMN